MISKTDYYKYFEYLDNLRESGSINMFGAKPYLKEEFNLSSLDSSLILGQWMATYDDDLSIEERINNV